MKSYTDLVQSYNLAEFLPVESADCFWDYDDLQKYHRINWFEEGYDKVSQLRLDKNNVCAWGLAALLTVLNYPELIQEFSGRWTIRAWDSGNQYVQHGFSNPVDACYAMITELHENNVL